MKQSFIFTFGAIPFSRGWDSEPSTIRGKVAFFSIIVAGALFTYHWEAMLISYLTSRSNALPFQNIDELLKKTTTNVVLLPGSASEDYFRHNKDPVWKEVFTTRIAPYLDQYTTTLEGLTNFILNRNDFSLYLVYSSGKYSSAYVNCEIIDVQTADYNYNTMAYAFPKDSPYLGPVNYILQQMKERGALDQIKDKYEGKAQVKTYSRVKSDLNNTLI